MSNIVPYQQSDPIQFSERIGKAIALSGMVQGCGSVEAGQVVALVCWAEGINPVQFGRRYHLIRNKPTMRADAMLAEFRMQGGTHEIVESTPDAAEIKVTDDRQSHVVRITWEEAQGEKWPWVDDDDHSKGLKDNWSTPRGRASMLWARACSEAIRRIAPEINAGIYTPEEATDFVSVSDNGHVRSATPDVIDSEVVVPDAAMPDVEQPEPIAESADELAGESQPIPKSGTRRAERIQALFADVGIDPQPTMESRGVKSWDELSTADADELIAKLEARAKN